MGLNVKNDDKIFKIQKFCHLKAIRQYKSTTRIDVSQNDSTFGNTALIFSICWLHNFELYFFWLFLKKTLQYKDLCDILIKD